MWEKFVLAVGLTFTLSLFVNFNWFSPRQNQNEVRSPQHSFFVVTEVGKGENPQIR
jgi:hypothetical protein